MTKRFLYGAILAGLNLLCFIGVAHGQYATRHTHPHTSQGMGRAGSRGGRSRQLRSMDLLNDHGAQVHAVKHAAAGPGHLPAFVAASRIGLLAPAFGAEPLMQERSGELRSLPRVPGSARGPPSA